MSNQLEHSTANSGASSKDLGELDRDSEALRRQLAAMLASVNTDAKNVRQLLSNQELPVTALPKQIRRFKERIAELLAMGLLDTVHDNEVSAIQHLVQDLPMTLKRFCEENAFQLGGANPDFIVDGIVYLGINSKNYSVELNNTKLPLFPLSRVFQQLVAEIASQKEQRFEPQAFAQRLLHAYDACCVRQRMSNQAELKKRVSVFDLLGELAISSQGKSFLRNPIREHYKPYSQHSFRADLFRLITSSDGESFDGKRLVLEPTSVAENGLFMYLPGLGRCAFVGHVLFSSPE